MTLQGCMTRCRFLALKERDLEPCLAADRVYFFVMRFETLSDSQAGFQVLL